MKNLSKLKAVLFFVAIIFLASCDDKTDDTTTPTSPKFTFLSVGHQWSYTMGDATTIIDTLDIKTMSTSGGGIFVMEMEGDSDTWYQSSNVFGFYDMATSTNNIICKADAKVNDTYTTIDNQDTSMNKVAALGVSVSVPGGTFSCYKVEQYYNSTLEGTFYINKESGIIKYEGSDGNVLKLLTKNF